ncbi:MAG: aminotransferase class I/II-fold pyridoxal phosphate-dependent enzyme [Bauldia sp.]
MRSRVAPFIAMDVMRTAGEREAAGARIVHMEVGQPGAAVPKAVREAAAAALADGRFGYTDALGRLDLRRRIARHYAEVYGVDVPATRIAITTGSSAAFNLAFLAAFDAGERVALASPGYPAYRNILSALGLEAVEIETEERHRHALVPEQLREAHGKRSLAGVLVASPANPTGTLMSPAALAALATAADDLGIRFISDEIYHGLVYAGRAETALASSPEAIAINSFSKYYCMTGWRVGWMVLPESLVRPVERLAQNLYISPPDISQRAALAAFDAVPELELTKSLYAQNRTRLLAELPRLGFDPIFPVDGAFYAYASTARLAEDSSEFASRMLSEAGVAATPGVDFDQRDGRHWMRFSFAGSVADVAEGMERLRAWLR